MKPVVTDARPNYAYYSHRSGHETLWRCERARFLNYHYLGTGIRRAPQYIHLEVGIAVHAGLASILQGVDIHEAIQDALSGIEQSDVWPFLQDYERAEQSTLIAGLLHTYNLLFWPPFRDQFEILFVERGVVEKTEHRFGNDDLLYLYMQSRPDAICRDKMTGEIIGLSWKTVNDLTDWRRKQFHNDLQGLLEMHYASVLFDQERASFELLEPDHRPIPLKEKIQQLKARIALVESLPNEVDYIQTVFLEKGLRTRENKQEYGGMPLSDESAEDDWQNKEYRQNSFLCYQWVNLKGGEPERSWAYRYFKLGNASYSNIDRKAFTRQPVWESDLASLHNYDISKTAEAWVQLLNTGKVFPSTVQDERNAKNPLLKVVIYDEPLYRDKAQIEKMVRQVRARELRTAERLYEIERSLAGTDTLEETRRLIDATFEQQLTACREPYACEFQNVCFGLNGVDPILYPEGVVDPVPEGYTRRMPHHEAEARSERFAAYTAGTVSTAGTGTPRKDR